MGLGRIILGKNQERRLRSGHLWVFSNEIETIEEAPEPGGETLVLDRRGGIVGVGLYNPHSLIAVRLFARRQRPIDEALFRERIQRAVELRKADPSGRGNLSGRLQRRGLSSRG